MLQVCYFIHSFNWSLTHITATNFQCTMYVLK